MLQAYINDPGQRTLIKSFPPPIGTKKALAHKID